MASQLLGLHHVTAICSDPQRNLDFYSGVLGLRLVKQTVNFDDPTRWHLYYGDSVGTPGTVITFFSWPDSTGGQVGIGQFGKVSFAIPASAFGYWIERLLSLAIPYQQPSRLFGELSIQFRDPDGLSVELVAVSHPRESQPWSDSPVPAEHAIRGIHGVSLWTANPETETFFENTLGFTTIGRESTTQRLAIGSGSERAVLDLISATGMWNGTVAVGSIHHVAWQVANDNDQLDWQAHLRERGVEVSDVRDRTYFHSIYFDAPGGALQEIATNGPGFTADEAPSELGTTLQLPPQLERMRLGLEGQLAPLQLPTQPRQTYSDDTNPN